MRKFLIFLFFCLLLCLTFFPHPSTHAQTLPSATAVDYLPFIDNTIPTPTPLDTEPPHIVTWSFAPVALSTIKADQVITFTAHFTDDVSGLAQGNITRAVFQSPSKQQEAEVFFNNPVNLISGTAKDGIYRSAMVVPRLSEKGRWQLDYLYLKDKARNIMRLYRTDLMGRGLPVYFEVTN